MFGLTHTVTQKQNKKQQQQTCKQILHFLGLPGLLVLLDVAGCLLSFYMRPFANVQPFRKKARMIVLHVKKKTKFKKTTA